jgi:hypothetical protein
MHSANIKLFLIRNFGSCAVEYSFVTLEIVQSLYIVNINDEQSTYFGLWDLFAAFRKIPPKPHLNPRSQATGSV